MCVCVLGSELVKRRKVIYIYSWDGPLRESKELSVGKCGDHCLGWTGIIRNSQSIMEVMRVPSKFGAPLRENFFLMLKI